MEGEFISDEEVEAYERRADPVRRSARWSLAAVAAAFALIGAAYLWGAWGGGSKLTASLLGDAGEKGEVFMLKSAASDANAQISQGNIAAFSAACGYESGPSTSPSLHSGQAISVVFSEIAWMGTEEGAQYEWIEIANTGNAPADMSGWSVVDKDEQIQFLFSKSANIPAGGFMLFARSADRVGSVKADFRYTGNLKNEDEGLRLFNEKCEVMDEVLAAPKWPAGDVKTKRTMERNFVTKSWHTSAEVGGTPKAANSRGIDGGNKKVEADSTEVAATSTPPHPSPTQGMASSTGSPQVVISEVMAGKDGAANWDFVELHNAGTSAVNLTGWSVKKKSSTGNESALVTSSRFEGKTISAGGYLLLAHPDYTGVPAADVVWPKSYVLAYTNNAVVLYGANGVKADEISWTEIPKGQSYAEINGAWAVSFPTPGQ